MDTKYNLYVEIQSNSMKLYCKELGILFRISQEASNEYRINSLRGTGEEKRYGCEILGLTSIDTLQQIVDEQLNPEVIEVNVTRIQS